MYKCRALYIWIEIETQNEWQSHPGLVICYWIAAPEASKRFAQKCVRIPSIKAANRRTHTHTHTRFIGRQKTYIFISIKSHRQRSTHKCTSVCMFRRIKFKPKISINSVLVVSVVSSTSWRKEQNFGLLIASSGAVFFVVVHFSRPILFLVFFLYNPLRVWPVIQLFVIEFVCFIILCL